MTPERSDFVLSSYVLIKERGERGRGEGELEWETRKVRGMTSRKVSRNERWLREGSGL